MTDENRMETLNREAALLLAEKELEFNNDNTLVKKALAHEVVVLKDRLKTCEESTLSGSVHT